MPIMREKALLAELRITAMEEEGAFVLGIPVLTDAFVRAHDE